MNAPTQNLAADPVLLELFRAELENHTRILEEGLVRAEAGQAPEKIEPLMRAAHSIKGAARMLAFDHAVRLAHAMEDVLVAAQRGTLRLTAAHVDVLLRSNDVFLGLAAIDPRDIPRVLEQKAEVMEQLAEEVAQPAAPSAPAAPAAPPAAPAPAPAPKPPPEGRPADDASVRVFAENLNRLVGLAGECLVETRLVRDLNSTLHRMKQRQAAAGSALERALEKLREGAAAEAESRLADCLEQFHLLGDLVPRHILEFGDFSRRLEVLVSKLYGEAVASRMRPFADGLHGFPRMVRDLAKELGKKARLEIEGASTPVDREILEKLEAPLTHLLRNALDHGIEPPAAREARGKPAEGKLTVSARHVSGLLSIAVSDDGAGISMQDLRRKVVAGGYVSEEIARDLRDGELLDFLFLPGFSTARTVSEVSGRGVGLDVVYSMVRSVGGTVRIQSKPGTGTTIELQLPLTLSVVRSLLAEIDGEIYAIPLTRIDRLVRAAPGEIQAIEDRQFCTVGGENIGIVDARQVFPGRHSGGAPANLPVVVISDRLNRYGLAVDRFLGERDLVVKAFPAKLGKVPNLSAGAMLEDGSPVLILDVDDVVRSIDNLLTRGSLKKVEHKEQKVRQAARKRVLVVEDSLTVREVERRLLENHGYEVVVAVDGMDGWNALEAGAFDLLVTDVDMPRMDGFELIRHVRAASRLAGLPVVIVSYKEQPEYRIQGMEAGANYYLTKSSFHDESLVGAVRDLIGEP